VPGRFFFRRVPFGMVLVAWRLWRHLPPAQRRQLIKLVSRHGPRLAQQAQAAARRRRGPGPG